MAEHYHAHGVHEQTRYTAVDAVHGTTDEHRTRVGAKAEAAGHAVAVAIPGTQAHRRARRTAAGSHGGDVYEKKTYTARDPVLGATGEHSTKFGARAAAAWRRVKSVVPGTKPYRARHGGAPHELHA